LQYQLSISNGLTAVSNLLNIIPLITAVFSVQIA
jgi:hypothetical protein